MDNTNIIVPPTIEAGGPMQIEPQIERVAELWFDDANVVFQAENKLFRVHRTILACQSPVFKDMFEILQPPRDLVQPSTIFEGCDFIQLVGDEAESVGYFFKAIYDASFFEPPPSRTELNIVLAIASLSHKYDVQFLRRRALEHLSTAYPTTLLLWDSRNKRNAAGIQTMTFVTAPLTIDANLQLIEVLNQIGATWMLPAAYYELCSQPLSEIMVNPKWCALDGTELQMACLLAWAKLVQVPGTSLQGFMVLADGLCEPCQEEAQTTLKTALDSQILDDFIDPLSFAEPTFEYCDGYCSPCADILNEKATEMREMFWRTLPLRCGLVGWPKLNNQKALVESELRAA
ncbi:hypothetical protein GALMADRAFT_255213 [Galerina marginata CBS 339.88]|uniref:BTB domain-containing protein n=1 Tax=Galerina marginata (strain CBS 339.88) TaxID=685588 RepID=A0A067SG59_GALM3|nr:hypothetical protein GALMADRAFT_255213 [Galerina marginata CBS 339.88]